ncbi:MAG: aspartate--tRNA ligase [bacterium]|nr:aspartate--tRNA ligase [bacterium]
MERISILDTLNHVGEEVVLKGWVNTRRKMGKMIFIDFRDRSGVCQVIFLPNHAEALEEAKKLGVEYCIELKGMVNQRPEKQVNKDLATGTVEIEALELKILSESETPPFEIEDEFKEEVNEELRLKHRYLDLRRERMQKNLILRHNVAKSMREYLYEQDFMEVETPILTKSTPEGARDFLVPSRNYPKKFYALPQSPQQYKQLLMVGGIEKYFQISRCFRDEDARGDRQPEFTQLDIEMSFVERDDVIVAMEELITQVVKVVAPEKKLTFSTMPRKTYQEVMDEYGVDRPDLRENKEDPNELAFLWVTDFPFFEKTEDDKWTFTHNPFSAAIPDHHEWLMQKENIGDIITTQYDMVLNGFEIGGGSIRNHQPEALKKVLEIIGYSDEEIQANFGHMLEAFKYGTPPHGGIAFGLDRLVAVLAGEQGIRDVIAFPKTLEGRDPMMDSPSDVDQEQLDELSIKLV